MATVLIGKGACTKYQNVGFMNELSNAGSVSPSGGFFFYSNSPEGVYNNQVDPHGVTKNALADKGYYLNKYTATGSGQVYAWHQNKTGVTIKGELRIFNPNNFSITVSSSNYGLTLDKYNDVAAWWDFWKPTATSVTIPANSWKSMFSQVVSGTSAAKTWGYFGRLSITNASGESTSAVLYDIAYISGPDGLNLTTHADKDTNSTTKRRGFRSSGSNYWAPITLNTITVGDTPQIFNFGATVSGDSFSGMEVPYITDPSGQTTGYLEGNYGVQHYFTVPVYNSASTSQKIRLFAGNHENGGACTNTNIALYGFGGAYGCDGMWGAQNYYVDFVEDIIPAKSLVNYTFQMVIPAGSCAPYSVGVKKA